MAYFVCCLFEGCEIPIFTGIRTNGFQVSDLSKTPPVTRYLAHRTCIDVLPSALKLTEGNAVLFAPLDGHLPKFDLLKLIPSVPQVIFRK